MDDLDFNDWVDQVYGFIHFLNPLQQPVSSPDLYATFMSEAINDDSILKDPTATILLSYDSFPLSEKSCEVDECLTHVYNWFATLCQPASLTEKVYTAFIQDALHFFLKDSHLWRRDPKGYHKVIIKPDK